MDNPFKKILHNEDLPEVLKDRVLNDVEMIKLSIDMADLFVVKYPNAISDLFIGGKTTSKDHTNKNDTDKIG